MQRLITRILVSTFFLFSTIALAQIQLVQVVPCGPASEPGTGCPIAGTGQGNLIVVGWQIGSHANTSNRIKSLSDNVGNVYSEVPGALSLDSAGSVADLWYAKDSIAGATTITITPDDPVFHGAAVIWEFAGADPIAPLDQASSLNSQPASTTPTGAAVTTTAADEAIISILPQTGNIMGIEPGNAFTNDALLKTNGWAHLIASNTGTYAAQWMGTSGTYASSTASFKAATGVPPTVSLSWDPSTSPNITGYYVFRGTVSGGPYSMLNTSPVPGTTYTDTTVQAGQTYYYVTTAIDYSGLQSVYSNQATAVVPVGQ